MDRPADKADRSRRALLGALLGRVLLFFPLILGWRAAGQEPPRKLSKQEADYQDMPRGGLRCAGCTFFMRPDACKVVAGTISPAGWCKLFDVPD